ncbi:M64 family metallopeptidase [Streptomyces sp. MspMP-M5]|uniref:M64 family metallopeptidase n=1 Tax=unclassified Streptomyces TaxID=2593676 RepID=UPI000380D79E|nr:M64 family metallopeptidase [Streptomyces sp. MspMP-M5]
MARGRKGVDGIATATSDNDRSDQIAVHETGHSLGRFVDEYDYGESGTYTVGSCGRAAAGSTSPAVRW